MRIASIVFVSQFIVAGWAAAQDYPQQRITLIVPFAPGGTADIIARPLASELGDVLGQTIIVDNRGGAGGVVGADVVARAAPDGYTLLLGSSGALTISQHLGDVPYDALTAFEPIGTAAISQFVLVTHPSVEAETVDELIALGLESPGRLLYGSAGVGNVGHLAGELFSSMTGVEMRHVPYAGAGPMGVDLIAGRVHLAFPGLSSFVPHIEEGSVNALAVTGAARSNLLPDVPTLDEAGLDGYLTETFWGLLAPAGTPPEIVERLNAALVQVLEGPDLQETYLNTGNVPTPSTPEEFAERIASDAEQWRQIVEAAGI